MSFTRPDLLHYGPVPFWFWNDKLSKPELRRQVRLMRDGGVRNFIIHARWGLKVPYLSAQWWSMIKTALDEAKAVGSRVWLYDEYNYPSGIGGFKLTRQARFRERFLSEAHAATTRGRALTLRLPEGKPLAVTAHPVQNGRLQTKGALPLLAALKGRRTLRWTPPDGGEWRVSAFCMQTEQFKGSGRYSVNYLAPEPTREFIRITHEAYARHLGKDLGAAAPAFFLDEPRFNNALPWDERFAAEFKRRKGYDLLPRLALLLHPGPEAEEARTRRDYYACVAELWTQNFFEPIGRWCKAHGMDLTGHLMAEETLAGGTRFSADPLKPYPSFSIPGADHLGKGIGGLAPKIAASMAAHQGASRVSCEAFAGCGQDFSMDEMVAMTHWLYSQGINLLVPHAFFYAMRTKRQKQDWPPSMFFQWKHWSRYPEFAARVARLSEALSGGRSVAEVALLHPTQAFQGAYTADPAYKTGYFKDGAAVTGRALALEHWFQGLGQGLQTAQIGMHVLGSAHLRRLSAYRALLLPAEAGLDAAARKRIAAFKANGGLVLEGDDPDALLARLKRALPKPAVRLRRPIPSRIQDQAGYGRIQDPYLHQGLASLLKSGRAGVASYRYRKPGEEAYFFANLTRSAQALRLRLQGRTREVELRWPADGRVKRVPVRIAEKGCLDLDLELPALESVLVAFKA